jgi:hypothetical protein
MSVSAAVFTNEDHMKVLISTEIKKTRNNVNMILTKVVCAIKCTRMNAVNILVRTSSSKLFALIVKNHR